MVTGESNADIGEELSVTEDINKFHVKHILNKQGAGHSARASSRYSVASRSYRFFSIPPEQFHPHSILFAGNR
jgi:hypothetical protein